MAFDMNEQHSGPDRVRAALGKSGLHPEIRQFAGIVTLLLFDTRR